MEWFDTPPPGLRDHLTTALDLPVSLRELRSGLHLLDLTRGPTGAFKDVGARVLARLWSVWPRRGGRDRTVLVATSGDTGGAVAAAIDGVPGVRGVVLFPADRVSEVQRRLFTTRRPQVRAVAVRGTFDDCQRIVRAHLDDARLVEAHGLVSANSINPGRLLPQTLYHAWAALHVPDATLVVPSGNLGNVTAAVMARAMGARIGAIHAAVNENDALVRAAAGADLATGRAVATDSNAMDVAHPSNLDRLEWLAARMDTTLRDLVHPVSISTGEARAAQRHAMEAFGVVVDPHTAVGIAAAMRLDGPDAADVVVVETAHPAKFPDQVRAVLDREPPPHEGVARAGAEEVWDEIPPKPEALRALLEGGPA
jgi:threonine synthase